MVYRIKLVTKVGESKDIEDIGEAINTEIIKALSEEEWEYRRESALKERLNYILGRESKLTKKANSVKIRGKEKALQLPGKVQGGRDTDMIVETVKLSKRLVMPLHEFYGESGYGKNSPDYIKYSYIDITQEKEEIYLDVGYKDVYTKSEKEARKNPAIDNIFTQGPRNQEDIRVHNHFYLKRPYLVGVRYKVNETEISVNSPDAGFVNIKPYKKIERDEMESKRLNLITKAKEKGIAVSYQGGSKKRIAEIWEQYEEDHAKSVSMYAGVKKGFEILKDKRGIREGFREDYYLRNITNTRLEYEALRGKGSIMLRVEGMYEDFDRMSEQIDKMEKGERGKIGRLVL